MVRYAASFVVPFPSRSGSNGQCWDDSVEPGPQLPASPSLVYRMKAESCALGSNVLTGILTCP